MASPKSILRYLNARTLLETDSVRASAHFCWGVLEVGAVLQSIYASIMQKISMTALFTPQVAALLACLGTFSLLNLAQKKKMK